MYIYICMPVPIVEANTLAPTTFTKMLTNSMASGLFT